MCVNKPDLILSIYTIAFCDSVQVLLVNVINFVCGRSNIVVERVLTRVAVSLAKNPWPLSSNDTRSMNADRTQSFSMCSRMDPCHSKESSTGRMGLDRFIQMIFLL